MFDALKRMREAGWSVACHNDYRLNGEFHTFWLFTHPSGVHVKGEGRTDEEALSQALAATSKWVGLSPAPAKTIPNDDQTRWLRSGPGGGPDSWHLFRRLPAKQRGEPSFAYEFQSLCQKAFMTEAAAAEAWSEFSALPALAAMLDGKTCRACARAGDEVAA